MFLDIITVKRELIVYGFLHDIAVAVYIGGGVAMEFVLGPAQKSIPPAQAQVMGQKTADRFLWLVWGSLGIIIVSAFLRLWRMDMFDLSWPFLHGRFDWDYDYGRVLFILLGIWTLLIINGLIITLVLRPRLAGRMRAGVSAAQVAQRQGQQVRAAAWVERLTRADLVLALLAALLGASLKFGGINLGGLP